MAFDPRKVLSGEYITPREKKIQGWKASVTPDQMDWTHCIDIDEFFIFQQASVGLKKGPSCGDRRRKSVKNSPLSEMEFDEVRDLW